MNHPIFATIAAGLLAAAPVAGLSAQPAANAAVQPRSDVALELAKLFVPETDLALTTEQNFSKGFDRALAEDQTSAQLERQFPGTLAAARAAGLKVVSDAMPESIRSLQLQYQQFLASEFTPAEQVELLAFMRSPTGRKLVSLGDQIYDTDKIPVTGKDGEPVKVTQEQIAAAVDYGVIAKFSTEELTELANFSRTKAGKKLQGATQKVQQLIADWVNQFMAAQMQPVQAAVLTAVRDHVAAVQRRTSQ